MSFEELMILTCNLRNQDSEIGWYLVEARMNTHGELLFTQVARPTIEKPDLEYSEFWAPIRQSGLFAGKPVPVRDEGWIIKSIRGTVLWLHAQANSCSVVLWFKGDNREQRRDQAVELFPEDQYDYTVGDTQKFAKIVFPVIDKGRKDTDDWPEIREKLTTVGADIYNRLKSSDV